MAAILNFFEYYTQLQFELRCEKIVPNYAKNIFHDDDVIDDVTEWPQGWPSIILYKWNNNIFHDKKTSKDIIIKRPLQRYHEIITKII